MKKGVLGVAVVLVISVLLISSVYGFSFSEFWEGIKETITGFAVTEIPDIIYYKFDGNTNDEYGTFDGILKGEPNLIEGILRIINAGEYLALDTIWAEKGYFYATETGQYRVVASFIDANEEVIGGLETSEEFSVS